MNENLLTLDKMLKISNEITNIAGKNYNYDNFKICIKVSKENLKKINEEFFYKTKKENDTLTDADMVIAKINGINYEFSQLED